MSRPVKLTLAALGFLIGATLGFLQPLPPLSPHRHVRTMGTPNNPVQPPAAQAPTTAERVQRRFLPAD